MIGLSAGAGLAAALALALILADPHGGEPIAVAALPPPKPLQPTPAPPAMQAVPPQAADPMPTGSTRATASPTALYSEGGVTVVRPAQNQTSAPGPLIIKVPQALGLSEVAAVDRRLVEGTRYGPLPKVAADGARSSAVYARPLVFTGTVPAGTPRIAIVVANLGLDAATTDAAIRTLPPAVTLSFSPYGDALDAAATRAKAAGHEVLLQLATADGGDRPPTARAARRLDGAGADRRSPLADEPHEWLCRHRQLSRRLPGDRSCGDDHDASRSRRTRRSLRRG